MQSLQCCLFQFHMCDMWEKINFYRNAVSPQTLSRRFRVETAQKFRNQKTDKQAMPSCVLQENQRFTRELEL